MAGGEQDPHPARDWAVLRIWTLQALLKNDLPLLPAGCPRVPGTLLQGKFLDTCSSDSSPRLNSEHGRAMSPDPGHRLTADQVVH